MNRIYLCSMGANLAPEQNFKLAKQQLTTLGEAWYSAALYTQPVAIETDHEFLNALLLLRTSYNPEQLKQQFNAIETSLGRDRTDPNCSHKDRPMDLDILGELQAPTTATHQQVWQQVPAYLADVVPDLQRQWQQLYEGKRHAS
ncbi:MULTISPECIES: 2-amino-4-hydroxy-6-hydroxymethyldihydropteridine diphosphokinase [Idiomarinaceae]|uniref:2-amino-4-hydroxy-6-hydroxymethyldihydropteridine pyrophosphokinase n=4 Tax=Pseudidiomarina TaxID=2800384 RepID=A0A368V3Q2_9GAMM|nr:MULTISPECIES: 2-amino-4-hydroxy-6-hydroxymethyldihydropteridine diphosphokinase [Idiomarinaceae]MDT7524651.1 2-amino-4-hydroxy-6-hydroxymethyldihydropteridine diphosphokinase [Pseudidiomarina sp. GXY010]MDX1525366.1 2-amino-4-hydroxy-6-hydroxymethyldihydropteridine diphosphokinase [Pseudidiomarina maritima]MRJ41341.1 2-amino-4-hydroxy-6-hydroxymethyldihydropteridine diphosphokinase [Idiomarina sp. FeN1]NCU56816.1 2-amino-4-hydroxy-6-hydroxymethyldihydropteridine diphosphokinase [Idiomarina s